MRCRSSRSRRHPARPRCVAPATHRQRSTLAAADRTSCAAALVAQMRRQHLEAFRYVEIHSRRNLAQIAHRLRDAGGSGPAFVDVQRCRRWSTPGRRCGCRRRYGSRAANRAAPAARSQERHGLPQHRGVAAAHAVRVDHRLGMPGGAGGQQESHDGFASVAECASRRARGRSCQRFER